MCCIDCLVALGTYHPRLDTLWQELTSETTLEKPFAIVQAVYPEVFNEDMKTLEESGYIVTHERDHQMYVVKILGFREGSQRICVHRHLT